MKKIRILFFIPQLVGGGAERVSMNIIKLLDKKVFEVHLVITTLQWSVYTEMPENIILHNLEASKTLYSIVKLRKLIKTINPDIFFSSLIRGHIASYIALIGLKKRPFTILRSPNSPKLLIKYNQIGKLQKYFLEHAYKTADLIVAQTPEMKEEIEYYHQIGKQKIDVLLNPIDVETINRKIKNITNPFDSRYINIVAAGRIAYQKGFDVLIKSFKTVINTDQKYRLFIIGEEDILGKKGIEEEIDKLKRIVAELNMGQYVQFLGYQENPYKYFYYSNLYVLSSRWEGLPNTVLENLYLHKPVIATRCIPFMDKLIEEGENGFLIDVDDEVALSNAILNHKNLSLKFSDTFDSKSSVNNFFRNVLNQKGNK